MALTKLNNQSLAAVTSAGIPIRSGSVLQVVQGTSTINLSKNAGQSDNVHIDTGLTASITPSATSSKILCTHSTALLWLNTSDLILNLVRGSSNIYTLNLFNTTGYGNSTGAFTYLDSPNSTSALTYKVTIYKNQNEIHYNYNNEATSKSTLTLMEIAG